MAVIKLIYLLLAVLSVLVNWYNNKNLFYAILAFFFPVFYLVYAFISGAFTSVKREEMIDYYKEKLD